MRTMLRAALVSVLLAAAAPAADAAGCTAPDRFIRDLGETAMATLRDGSLDLAAREARFRALLERAFDLDFVSRFVLGRHWRRATSEQREEFREAFRDFVLKTYSARLGGYAGERFSIGETREAGRTSVMVRTRIERPSGPPIQADWRVRTAPECRIIDVTVEGVSMVITHREEMDGVIARQGLDRLVEILRAKSARQTAVGPGR